MRPTRDNGIYSEIFTELQYLDELKYVLGLPVDDHENDWPLYIALCFTEKQVLSYIHHETLPEQLRHTLIMIAAAYWKATGIGSEQAASGPVTSVKRGDITTSFAGAADTFGRGDGDGFFGWRTTLNAYRKLRW